MKRKMRKNQTSLLHAKSQSNSVVPFFVIVLLMGIVFLGTRALNHTPRVLGTNISMSSNSAGWSAPVDDANSGAIATIPSETISNTTLVDCIGPDGKHLQISFKACAQLHSSWHSSQFSFTSLGLDKTMPQIRPPVATPIPVSDSGFDIPNVGDVKVEDIDVTGTESAVEASDSAATLPNRVEKILPSQAVVRLVQNHVLDTIQSQGGSLSGNLISPSISVQSLNNQSVYEVSGLTNKKLFGFIPFSYAKTVFISTQTGVVLKVNQTFFSSLLEKLSF